MSKQRLPPNAYHRDEPAAALRIHPAEGLVEVWEAFIPSMAVAGALFLGAVSLPLFAYPLLAEGSIAYLPVLESLLVSAFSAAGVATVGFVAAGFMATLLMATVGGVLKCFGAHLPPVAFGTVTGGLVSVVYATPVLAVLVNSNERGAALWLTVISIATALAILWGQVIGAYAGEWTRYQNEILRGAPVRNRLAFGVKHLLAATLVASLLLGALKGMGVLHTGLLLVAAACVFWQAATYKPSIWLGKKLQRWRARLLLGEFFAEGAASP